jgi:hypothetical protein
MEQRDLGAPDLRIHYVRITNHLDVPFTDRHDGVPVSIPPGKSDNLPLDMAAHFFGYAYEVPRDVMFRHVCKRQGWNSPAHIKTGESGQSLAEELFSKLEIKPVVYKMVEQTVDTDAPIPADPELPTPAADDDGIPALPPRRKAGAA